MKPDSSFSSKRFLKAAGSIMRPLASIAISNSPKKKLIISGFNTCYKYKITTFTTIYHNLTQNILSTLKKKHKSLKTNENGTKHRFSKNKKIGRASCRERKEIKLEAISYDNTETVK